MLIPSPRHTARDLERWAMLAESDAIQGQRVNWIRKVQEARAVMARFAEAPCYVGVSWGKDSVVVAHLAREMGLPLIWVRTEHIENPDCPLVRDAFLARFPCPYTEITVPTYYDQDGHLQPASGTLKVGAAMLAAQGFPSRYISGVRAQESSSRASRMKTYGFSTDNTCAPIGWWKTWEVWAYLHVHDLPIHPAYACTMGGTLNRDRLRVAPLSRPGVTQRLRGAGYGHGRYEWECRYYAAETRAIEKASRGARMAGTL